jgi:hypothetical protein
MMIGASGLAAPIPGRQEMISNRGERPLVITVSRMPSLFGRSVWYCMITSLLGLSAIRMDKKQRLASAS